MEKSQEQLKKDAQQKSQENLEQAVTGLLRNAGSILSFLENENRRKKEKGE